MFLDHAKSFTEFKPAEPARRARIAGATMLETEAGWRRADTLKAGDRVATLDGGFAEIVHIAHREATGPLFEIPAQSFGNTATMRLSGDQYLAISDPALLSLNEAPWLLLPVSALAGYNGIQAVDAERETSVEIAFRTEEVVYAETGALIHVPAIPNDPDGFFPRLDYGQARAALALMGRALCAPDRAAA